jgi:hypothetical protein
MPKKMHVCLLVSLAALLLFAAMPASALAAGRSKSNDPLNAPTFQQQSRNWTSAQWQTYNTKLQKIRLRANCPTSAYLPACGPPSSLYLAMGITWEGSADCACGPATATEMFNTLTQYFNSPPYPYLTLSQVEAQMGFSCSAGTYRYQLLNEMNNGKQTVNTYVWQAVNSASDVHYYTQNDVGYDIPIGYDGETYGPDGYPLDNYQKVNWKHYFPAYGYSPGWDYVADPHFAYDHGYTDRAIYLFIDNFPYTNQVLW